MADNVANTAMLDVSKGVSQMDDSINNLTQTIASSKNKENPDGLTLTAEDNSKLEELIEQMKSDIGDTFEQLAPLLDNVNIMADSQSEIQKFQKDSTDLLNELLVGQQSEAAEMLSSPSSRAAKKQTATSKPNGIDMLKDLSATDGLGFVALWWKLDEINDTLKKGDDKKKKGGNIGDIFKGLLEGAAGIALLAVALTVFAGALILFQFVEWPSALAGMVAFSIFTIGFIQIAKHIGKSVDDFVKMAVGAGLMSLVIGVFAGALILMKFIEWGPALAGLGLFALFTLGMLGVARLVNDNTKNFLQFALGSAAMAGALLAFSVSIMFSSWIMKAVDVNGAFEALGFFAIFTLGMIGVSHIVGDHAGDMVKFALGSKVMAGALAVFSVGLAIASNIFAKEFTLKDGTKIPLVNKDAAWDALKFFGVFTLGTVLLANLAGDHIGDLTKFALASMLMTASLVLFCLALSVAGGIFTTGFGVDVGGNHYGLDKVDAGAAIGALITFVGFMAAYTGLAVLANNFISQIAIFTGVSALMSLSLIMFGFAISTAVWAMEGGDMNLGPLGSFSSPKGDKGLLALEALAIMATFTAAYALMGVGLTYAGPFALLAAGILIPVAGSIILMTQAMSFAASMSKGGTIQWEGKQYDFPSMEGINWKTVFDPFKNVLNALKEVASGLGIFGGLGIQMKLKPLAATVIDIAKATKDTLNVYNSMKDKEGKVNGGFVEVFEPFIKIMGALAGVANTLDKESRKSLKVVAEAMVPVSETLGNLVKMVNDYAEFSNEEGRAKMDSAIEGMNYIMLGDSGTGGFVGIMNNIAFWLRGMSERALTASQAMVPVTQALGNLITVIAGPEMTELMKNKDSMADRMDAMNSMGDFFEDHLVPVLNKIGKKEKNIQAAIPIFGKSPEEGLWSVLTSLAGIMKIEITDQLSPMAEGISTFVKSLDNLSSLDDEDVERMNSLAQDIPAFATAVANFNSYSQAVELAASINLIKNSLSDLSGKNNPFKGLTESIESSTKAIGTLNNRLDDTINKMKKLGKETTNAFAKVIDRIESSITTASIAADTANAAATGNAVGSVVETILRNWDKNGVPVRGNQDESTPPVRIFAI